MTTLNDFLRKCSIAKDDKKTKPTHTRIGNMDAGIYGGSFHIPDEKTKLFYQLYYNEIINGKGEEYLTEKQNENSKFYVDLDFRYNYHVETRQHTKDDIISLVGAYADIMKEYVDFCNPFDVYVMEKDNVNRLVDQTLTKDGIHILFDVEIPRPLHSTIRERMIEKCDNDDLIELPLINNWESVFDEGISKGTTNCQLFGSKKPLHDAYKLTYIFNMELDHNDNEFMMEEQHDKTMTKELFLKLVVREAGNAVLIKNKGIDIINKFNTKKETKPKPTTNTIIANQMVLCDNEPTTEIYSWFKKGLEYDLFDKMIKKCEGVGRQVWFRLAFLLKDDVGEHGENMFVELSKTHDKFDEDKVRDIYKKLSEYPKPDKPLSIATLKKLYKEVDNESYELINEYFKGLKKQQKGLQKELQKGELHESLKKQLEDKLIEQKEEADNYEFDNTKLDRFNTNYFMTLGSYELKKKYFEKFVCKVLRPEPVYIYCETETNMSNDLCIYSQNKIIETFKHLNFIDYVEKGDNIVEVKKSFIMEWIEDEHLLEYNKLDFVPYNENKPIKDKDRIFNTFRGFNPLRKTKYDATKKEALLKPFKDLWLQLCGGEQKNFDYFYKFIAQMFQEPNKRIPVAFIIKGKQGTGKNVGLEAIGNVLGRNHYKSSCNPKDFFGDYAEGFVNQLLVNMNECEGKDTFDFEGKIKGFISEDQITLNQKYLRPIPIANLARTIIYTNKANPIPIDVRSKDRRFVVYQTTDYFLDKKYGTLFWTKLISHFNRPDFIACLYDDLMSQDISKMDWKGSRPITQAYMDMCKLYVPVEVLFFEDYCINHKIQPQFLSSNVYIDKIECVETGTELYKLFNEFCSKYKFNRTGERNIKSFYSRIIELELPFKMTIPQNIKTYHFNTHELLTFFKEKAWIDRSDDDVIDISQDNSGEEFDDLFNI